MTLKLDDGFTGLLEIKDPQDFIIASGGKGGTIIAKVNTLDDVLVLEGEFFFA